MIVAIWHLNPETGEYKFYQPSAHDTEGKRYIGGTTDFETFVGYTNLIVENPVLSAIFGDES